MVQFKRYSLYELFDEKVGRGTRLTRAHRVLGDYPLATAGEQNTGVSDWIVENKQLFPANSITIDMFGNVFYRSYDFYADDNILVLHRDDWSKEVMLYVTAQIHHVLKDRFDYSRQFRQKVLKTVDIELPVTQSGTPDFSYMTKKIRELEAERIRELEAYLKVAGLDDTTLSGSEAAALTQKVVWKKFRIGDLFEKVYAKFKGKAIDIQHDVSKTQSDEFNLPVVSVLSDHNGIMYYGRSSEWASVSNSIDIVQNGVKATGSVFYQSGETSSFRDAYLVKFKTKELTREESLYMVGSLKAVLPKAFNRERLATWTRVQDAIIQLPVTLSGDIDFHYMQNYIRAIEKQTIDDVVKYKDRMINDTKKMVNN